MFNYNQLDPGKCRFYAIGKTDELTNGERLFLEIEGEYLVIFNVDGKYFAIADLCSHDKGSLGDGELENHQIICPRHGARFDIETGEALTLPAVEDIPAYPVRIKEGVIEVGIPEE